MTCLFITCYFTKHSLLSENVIIHNWLCKIQINLYKEKVFILVIVFFFSFTIEQLPVPATLFVIKKYFYMTVDVVLFYHFYDIYIQSNFEILI